MLAGIISNPYPVSGVDIGPQPEPHWSAQMGPPGSTYGLGHQVMFGVVALEPPAFPPGYPESSEYHHGLLGQPVGGSGGFFPPGAGVNVNPVVGVGYNNISTHEGIWLEWGDPGIFPRCGLDPGGPVHLTMNVSAASSQVSSQSLSEEVCHYSVRKTIWY